MTIDNVINRELKAARDLEDEVERGVAYKFKLGFCGNMNKVDITDENLAEAKEHRQIAEWLEDYKKLLSEHKKVKSSVNEEDVIPIINLFESALKGTKYCVFGHDNTDTWLKVIIDKRCDYEESNG